MKILPPVHDNQGSDSIFGTYRPKNRFEKALQKNF